MYGIDTRALKAWLRDVVSAAHAADCASDGSDVPGISYQTLSDLIRRGNALRVPVSDPDLMNEWRDTLQELRWERDALTAAELAAGIRR